MGDTITTPSPPIARRPLASRGSRWAAWLAARLVALGLRPNQVSIVSVVFGAGAGGAYFAVGRIDSTVAGAALLTAAALMIQMRLLCNLMDGMMAVEGGLKSPSGEIYNDLPDRVADAFILIGAGYVMHGPQWAMLLGWSAAILAIITAYVRVLGAAAGTAHHFIGPMAKQHRMAIMTIASIAGAVELVARGSAWSIAVALAVVILGCAVTIIRRTRRIIHDLEDT
jgi:phosphatidylglycerophosphate synthase